MVAYSSCYVLTSGLNRLFIMRNKGFFKEAESQQFHVVSRSGKLCFAKLSGRFDDSIQEYFDHQI